MSGPGRKLKVAVNGCCGRMGRRLVELIRSDESLEVAAAIEEPGHGAIGQDVGELCGLGAIGVKVESQLSAKVDVAIDFSSPEGTAAIARACQEQAVPLVVATTGLNAEQRRAIESASRHVPVVLAPNMSMCVNLLLKLVGEAAATLKDVDVDIEIIERHHRYKKDAPSGTALEFARVIADAGGPRRLVHGRHGPTGARPRDEIGIHAVRGGDCVGEHVVQFNLLGETVEFVHRAHNRDCFARGALQAARFVVGRKPGMYTMADVLGLR